MIQSWPFSEFWRERILTIIVKGIKQCRIRSFSRTIYWRSWKISMALSWSQWFINSMKNSFFCPTISWVSWTISARSLSITEKISANPYWIMLYTFQDKGFWKKTIIIAKWASQIINKRNLCAMSFLVMSVIPWNSQQNIWNNQMILSQNYQKSW